MYGPPGTGKTSFTLAVAGAMKLNICYLNLSSGRLNDDSLNNVLANSPANSIILLEDIDAIFVQRESVFKKSEKLQRNAKNITAGTKRIYCSCDTLP